LEKKSPNIWVSGNYYGLTGKFPGMSNSEKKFSGKNLIVKEEYLIFVAYEKDMFNLW